MNLLLNHLQCAERFYGRKFEHLWLVWVNNWNISFSRHIFWKINTLSGLFLYSIFYSLWDIWVQTLQQMCWGEKTESGLMDYFKIYMYILESIHGKLKFHRTHYTCSNFGPYMIYANWRWTRRKYSKNWLI